MTHHTSTPKRILLATDLSSRSDRALDRAAHLAREWNAELVVVHAMEAADTNRLDAGLPSWRQAPNPILTIQRQIRRDLREEVSRLRFHIKEGAPVQVILDAVVEEECDLIIVGSAHSSLTREFLVGSTVDTLIRKSPVSVLVVKSRPDGPYRHLLVGTDYTDESRYGLEFATASFAASEVTLMHVFELPYATSLYYTAPGRDVEVAERKTLQEFASKANLREGSRARLRLLVEHGQPEMMLRRYVEEREADLTVIGAYARGFLFHTLVKGNAPRIVDTVPSDILLVRAPRETLEPPEEIKIKLLSSR